MGAAAGSLVMSPHDAVHARLAGIESFSFPMGMLTLKFSVALPAGYARARRQRYPLLVLVEAGELFGSAVEMSRMLAVSREAGKCIVVNVESVAGGDATLLAAAVAECCRRYRVMPGEVAVFGHAGVAPRLLSVFGKGIEGVSRCIVGTAQPLAEVLASLPESHAAALAWSVIAPPPARAGIHWKQLPECSTTSLAIPALLHGLRTFWGRPHRYGDEVLVLSHPLLERILRTLAPLLRPLTRRRAFAPEIGNPRIMHSQAAQRDFEISVALPASAAGNAGRRYPTLIALDANGSFATVAETAARLARAGEIEEAIVVGIGTPRSQGDLEFAFRRFEELSPPAATDYRYDDKLGRFFRALFSLRGQDARVQLGQAPAFLDFIASELLPDLVSRLPIDPLALTLIGHSAAGTFAGFALAQPQSPFAGVMCLSPGISISGDWMLHNAAVLPDRHGRPVRVFVALGAEELRNPFNAIAGIPKTQAWVELLRQQGMPALQCHVLAGDTHTTVYPRAVAQGLRALLGRERAAEAAAHEKSS